MKFNIAHLIFLVSALTGFMGMSLSLTSIMYDPGNSFFPWRHPHSVPGLEGQVLSVVFFATLSLALHQGGFFKTQFLLFGWFWVSFIGLFLHPLLISGASGFLLLFFIGTVADLRQMMKLAKE